MKKLVLALLKSIIGLGLLFIAYELAVWAHPPAIAWGLSAAGLNPHCPAAEAYRGMAGQAGQRATIESIAARTRLLGEDGPLNHYHTPHGEFWIPRGSDAVLPKLLAQQQARIYGEIQPGEVVVDCGAHVGTFTRFALNAGARLVVAVEPSPQNVEALQRGFRGDIAAGRVIVVPKGVWDREEFLPLYTSSETSAGDSFVIKSPHDTVVDGIPLTTIDRIAAEYRIPKVTLIKMDIKGATLRALDGGQATIRRDRPRLVIATEEAEDEPAPIIESVGRMGAYRHSCGICSVGQGYQLNPDVLFFR